MITLRSVLRAGSAVLEIGTGLTVAIATIPPFRRPLAAIVLAPSVRHVGYTAVTAFGLVWGSIWSTGRLERHGDLIVASGCPNWTFGRGGTTVGGVYITRSMVSPAVIEHEDVHRQQWRRYGLALLPLYLAAGRDATRNRFEIEAGLERGGYR